MSGTKANRQAAPGKSGSISRPSNQQMVNPTPAPVPPVNVAAHARFGPTFEGTRLRPTAIQTKMTVGPAGGAYEQEADTVASRVVQSLDSVAAGATQGSSEAGSGKASVAPVQLNTTAQFDPTFAEVAPHEKYADVPEAKSGGKPLPPAIQAKAERAYGHDFSTVRVHEGQEAGRVGAWAYARGENIYFQPGQLDAQSKSGEHLLGHEIAHVVQQREGRVAVPEHRTAGTAPINADVALEGEADRMAERMVSSASPAAPAKSASGAVTVGIQRKDATSSPESYHRFGPSAFQRPSASGATPIQRVELFKKSKWFTAEERGFTDKNINKKDTENNVDNIGGGAINPVDKVAYKHPIDTRTGNKVGFFKEDLNVYTAPNKKKYDRSAGGAADDIGILGQDKRLANRSVATSALADVLNTDVIARTEYAIHNKKKGTVSVEAQGKSLNYTKKQDMTMSNPGMLEEFRKNPDKYFGNKDGFVLEDEGTVGISGVAKKPDYIAKQKNGTVISPMQIASNKNIIADANFFKPSETVHANYFDLDNSGKFNLNNPVTQRGMNDLQWMDALTGQVDRHGGNIFVDPDTGKVTGIDNDAAFGSKNSDDPEELTGEASHFKGIPDLVDTKMATHLTNLDAEKLTEIMRANNLNDKEIEGAVARLNIIKTKIKDLEEKGHIVGAKDKEGTTKAQHADWGQSTYDLAVQEASSKKYHDPKISYMARSIATYQEKLDKEQKEKLDKDQADAPSPQPTVVSPPNTTIPWVRQARPAHNASNSLSGQHRNREKDLP